MSPVCILLGAGPGVGQSVAKKFLGKGYHVALIARNESKLKELQGTLGDKNLSVWPLDVSDVQKLQTTFSEIAEKHGDPEVLVFNAYSASPGKPTGLSPVNLQESLKLNVTSALAAAQAVIPAMQKAKKGTIVFTGGGFALYPLSDMTALSVGKAALRALANCLYQELKPSGIHAGTVTICGMVKADTPFDPDKIADAFIEFHEQAADEFVAEIMFEGN